MKPWSVEECEAYAKQLRDKTRANTAEDAAQAIEYLLGLVRREWVGLTKEDRYQAIRYLYRDDHSAALAAAHSDDEYEAIEAKLKEKNT